MKKPDENLSVAISTALSTLLENSSVLGTYWQSRLTDPVTGLYKPELITEQILNDLLDDVFYCKKWPGI